MALKSELDVEIAEMLDFYQAAAARSDSFVADARLFGPDQAAASSHAAFSAPTAGMTQPTADHRRQG
jgi:hypothetical protein